MIKYRQNLNNKRLLFLSHSFIQESRREQYCYTEWSLALNILKWSEITIDGGRSRRDESHQGLWDSIGGNGNMQTSEYPAKLPDQENASSSGEVWGSADRLFVT